MLAKRLPAMLAAWVLLTLAAGPAAGSDEIGVFFDATAVENCIVADQSSTLDAYLLLLEPSASGGVFGWECAVEIENVLMLGVTLAGQGINVSTIDSEFIVGLASPLPAGPVVELARYSILVLTRDPVGFYLNPVSTPSTDEDLPAYADGADPDNLLPLEPRVIGTDNLVAGINRPGCIPEDNTWGRVKTIYEGR